MAKDIELPKKNCPWELEPKDNIPCDIKGCFERSITKKLSCDYHACPYSNDGDDGYF